MALWQKNHIKVCTIFRQRCEDNARDKIEDHTNAAEAWKELAKFKPRGSGMLNSTFKKFESLTLASCDSDPQTYASKFVGVLREFKNFPGKLNCSTDENWKIYHFHKGLGPQYQAYCEQYSQNHDSFDEKGGAKYDLDYAMTRFVNTIINPINSTSEATALAAIIGGSLGHTAASVFALVTSGAAPIEHKIQPGANSTNSRTYTQTCKHCKTCDRDWHSTDEHDQKMREQKRKRDESENPEGRGNRGV